MMCSSKGVLWFYFISAAERNSTKIMSLSPNAKITLEEYLQAHKIQKKLEERNRSRSKGKERKFENEQEESMQNTFALMDSWSYELKIDFHQFLSNNEPHQKLIFHLSKLMDKFVTKMKEEIKKMYKDIYLQYIIQYEKQAHQETVDYFKGKVDEADLEVKKMHLAEMFRERIKNQEKKQKIMDAIFKQKKKEGQDQKQVGGGFFDALIGMARKNTKSEQNLDNVENKGQKKIKEENRQNNHLNALDFLVPTLQIQEKPKKSKSRPALQGKTSKKGKMT